ncbi:hypothetical protein B0T26DRAFT_699773 [Lasiosphaeria miniovina]|uniref:Uncharacterized protein n=1 Tax=Lasiosphaeria miniovina TaxID=1954250 RepID=A0AA40ATD5_9PEZI|nr:uncharacterized protein B0T26DRAFT_699773 [Lasiosphaeria miniovina]KAK0721589.1 hypothetical protein B0T26DRAFT_699773 [Lasiosphaeria miniovina]
MVHSAVDLNNLNWPDYDAYAASANRQSGSRLFKALPAEVRQLIYVECWRASGLRQHVFRRKTPLPPVLRDREGRLVRPEVDPYQAEEGLWTRASCTTDPCADDVRWPRFCRARPGQSADASMWAARLRSDWCLHWACEEEDTGHVDHYRRQNRLSRMLQQDLFWNTPAVHRHYEREIEEAPPSDPPARRWAGFLPVMLTCKQMCVTPYFSLCTKLTLGTQGTWSPWRPSTPT